MKRGSLFLPVMLLGSSVMAHAFTLDIANREISEFGQGPRSIFMPGYGEVVFESGLDGTLVVNSAYASTDRIKFPPPSGESAAGPFTDDPAADINPAFVKITHRKVPELSPPLQATLYPVDAALQNPPGDWNAVPEAASAALGLVGTLILLLRRRAKTMTTA